MCLQQCLAPSKHQIRVSYSYHASFLFDVLYLYLLRREIKNLNCFDLVITFFFSIENNFMVTEGEGGWDKLGIWD